MSVQRYYVLSDATQHLINGTIHENVYIAELANTTNNDEEMKAFFDAFGTHGGRVSGLALDWLINNDARTEMFIRLLSDTLIPDLRSRVCRFHVIRLQYQKLLHLHAVFFQCCALYDAVTCPLEMKRSQQCSRARTARRCSTSAST